MLLATLAGCVADLRRPPGQQLTARCAVAAIGFYQRHLSRWAAAGGARCRFTPTCSRYAAEAIRRHGLWRGGRLAAWRILRCGPWTPPGTVDEVPLASGAGRP